MMRKLKTRLLTGTCAIAALLSACATQPLPTGFDNRAFFSGATRLGCASLLCASKWRLASEDIFQSYASGDWIALIESVEGLGYDSDIAYFYLGRAADELGAPEAARAYFRLARATSKTCSTDILGDCHGIDVAREAGRQLSEIESFDVARAQRILAGVGLYTIRVDGIVGPRTVAALEKFQDNLGLRETGALNAETRRALMTVEGVVESNRMAMSAPRNKPAPGGFEAPPAKRQTRRGQPERRDRQVAPGQTVASSKRTDDRETVVSSAPAATSGEPAAAEPAAATARRRVVLDVELLSEADPFAEVVAVVEQGEWVEVLSRGAEWAKISHDQATGYVYSDLLQ